MQAFDYILLKQILTTRWNIVTEMQLERWLHNLASKKLT